MNAPTRIFPTAPTARMREARTLPASFNEADNSFEVCWSTGAAVTRFDWMDGEYYDETLSLEPGAVRLDRLNDSGPVLDSHNDRQLSALVGSVVAGTARIERGEGVARVRLADSPDVANICAKVKGGHLRKVSVAYSVYAYDRIDKEGERPELRAVDWEPLEISLVSLPADPGAKIRSEDRHMNQHHQPHQRRDAPVDQGALVTPRFIRDKCRSLGLTPDETLDLIDTFGDGESTQVDFLERMVDLVALKRQGHGVTRAELTDRYVADRHLAPIDNTDSGRELAPAEQLARRMQGAVYARISGKAPAEESREFMGASMLDLARGLLMARGEKAQWLSPSQIFKRYGAQTTSDFTGLLDGALNAYLTEQYAAAPSPLMQLAKPREVADFREIKALSIHGSPELLLVEENAEYTYSSFGESGEAYRIHTFGRIISMSRQLIINDNLGAFAQVGAWYARSAGQKRAAIVAALIGGNVALADNVALFHADHGNLAASGGPINVATLSAARQAMRAQKDRDGVTLIDVAPKYLVVGPAKETEAEQALTALNAATAGEANPFPGKLTLLVDVRLLGNAWYLFADPAAVPVLEYATLTGRGDTVDTDTRMGFEVDGIETKARIDFGAGLLDFRGAYKNPGN